MNIRNAILMAAAHIERHPQEFRFSSIRVPSAKHCGTPGCALGWIGTFAAATCQHRELASDYDGITIVAGGSIYAPVETSLLGISATDFYERMNALPSSEGWRGNASICAFVLRLYADKYHPATDDSRQLTGTTAADVLADLRAGRVVAEVGQE